MNHDLIMDLFSERFNKEIEMKMPFVQKFFTEDDNGSVVTTKVIENSVQVIQHKQEINHRKFLTIYPRYGVGFFVAVSKDLEEIPIEISIMDNMKRSETTLIDMTTDEVEYFIAKFIREVSQDAKKSI